MRYVSHNGRVFNHPPRLTAISLAAASIKEPTTKGVVSRLSVPSDAGPPLGGYLLRRHRPEAPALSQCWHSARSNLRPSATSGPTRPPFRAGYPQPRAWTLLPV
jgi:hypothetical protein